MGMVNLEAVVTADASDIADILGLEPERAAEIHTLAKEKFEGQAASA